MNDLANRAFLARATRYQAGIRQFLDVGTGFPALVVRGIQQRCVVCLGEALALTPAGWPAVHPVDQPRPEAGPHRDQRGEGHARAEAECVRLDDRRPAAVASLLGRISGIKPFFGPDSWRGVETGTERTRQEVSRDLNRYALFVSLSLRSLISNGTVLDPGNQPTRPLALVHRSSRHTHCQEFE